MDADPNTSPNGTTQASDEYDSPWKEAIEVALGDFMAFYFPAPAAQIDWHHEPVFLEQELRQVVPEAEAGRKVIDKLARVSLLDGLERWVYIHIEIQGSRDADFARRMLTYHARLLDRYQRPVASFAILADDSLTWRPGHYRAELFGCVLELRFPVVKLNDYADQLAALLAHDNPFALVTAAHLLTRQTRQHPRQRYEAKLMLIKLLHDRRWPQPKIDQYLRVLDWMMRLPAALKQQLWQDILVMKEARAMRYVTSFEELAMEEGMKKGMQAGQRQTADSILRKLLILRFGPLPPAALARLDQADTAQLEAWAEKVLFAESLEAVFSSL